MLLIRRNAAFGNTSEPHRALLGITIVHYNRHMLTLTSPFSPTGDQPTAINSIVEGITAGRKNQVLLGVTGSGKTFTIANVIQ